MTAITQVQLVAPAQLGATDAAIYTAPAATIAKIGRAVFTNTSATAVTITAGITPGVPLAAATTLISARPLGPGEAYISPELAGEIVPAASAIHAYASAAGAVTVAVSGLTIV